MIYLIAQYLLKDLQKTLIFFKSYLLLDLLFVITSILFYINFGISSSFIINILLLFYLFVISITDFKYQIIPDKITYLYIIIGLIITLLSDNLLIDDALIGMLCGFLLSMTISAIATKLFKKPAMGGGDIKLAAMLGIYIGWYGFIMSLFIASVIALIFVSVYSVIYRKRITTISFGPFLVLSAIIILSYKQVIIEFVLSTSII